MEKARLFPQNLLKFIHYCFSEETAMLKHVVAFKLKAPTPALLEETRRILLSMEGKVPMLRSIEVGVDVLHSERSYDVILMVTLDDEAALAAYQQDPYHVSVVKKHMHAVRLASVAADYYL
jgi:hypothetical protein